ncbi:pseudaminic acid synthase [Chlorobium ferrooxidans]|uniref:N-acylneuraminate-9-phosphate synthase n=1 Tax=Chlorobium ferrooxidans DSM 13031 TaxID=377431 RepID=Q0YTS4_9CHLB|nr:pseudaminic acid synthase [Chlorobium ferrooxidans]EAT59827.1 N-acylneuraminate-9-phosphate synthase [Chlorobium ferrooxidans DSM 13031]
MENPAKYIHIGRHTLGPGHPAFIVAEMSGNHGGSLEYALEIVHAAKRSGADAIKLQTYTADTITLNSDRQDFCIPSGTPWADHSTLWSLYNKAYTPWDWHESIFREARSLDLEIFSSPFDESAVELLEQLGASAYKIASPEITHIPLLDKVARTGKPVILSTGLAALEDIELALATLRAAGSGEIILLKCTTAYPAPIEEANLRTISDMISRFGVLAGLSDHTTGAISSIVAVSMGASFIEKHFTIDKAKETVDSFFSADESEFASLVKDIRLAEKAMGEVSYEIARSALSSLNSRRSLYVAEAIKAGDLITDSNVKTVRPAFGLHPRFYKEIIGRQAKCDMQAGDRLQLEMLQ